MPEPTKVVQEDGTIVTTYASGEVVEERPMTSLPEVSGREVEKQARDFLLGRSALGSKKEIRSKLEAKVIGKIGSKGAYLVDKLFELIEGIYILDKNRGPGGKDIRYYQIPPNLEAIKYALDRVIGKPTQHVEATDEKTGVITVEHVIKQLAGNPYGRTKETRPAQEESSAIVAGNGKTVEGEYRTSGEDE